MQDRQEQDRKVNAGRGGGMIVPMKKCALIMLAQDAEQGIKSLRKLGSVHIEHEQAPASKDISALQENVVLIDEVINILNQEKAGLKESAKAVEIPGDWKQLALHILDSQKKLIHLDEYSRSLADSIRTWEKWGDFDPQAFQRLIDQQVNLKLYQIPVKALKSIDNSVALEVIFVNGSNANCLAASRFPINLPYKEIVLPKMGLEQMRRRFAEDKATVRFIHEDLRNAVGYSAGLNRVKSDLEKELLFHQALKGMGESQGLVYLKGYIPVDAVDSITAAAKKFSWGSLITDPGEEEVAPVLLRNPRWISLINPVFRFLEIFPGYRELDISSVFLIFFSIFFGILIGDAGYGLVYGLLAFLFQMKKGRQMADESVFFLLYLLSFCAIIWGLLTGTFFGQEWFLKAGYKPLVPALNDMKFLQAFCFFLGAAHLTIAHAWRGLIKLPSWGALVDLGWICILWASFFLARTLILGDVFPAFGKWIIITGITLVVFFTNPQKNIFKSIGEGLGNLALSLMNNFTDVVSYVRLFAVGLAGVAISDAFNSMAGGIGKAGGLALVGGVLVAVVGQCLGMILGPISVLVHGVRLNVL